MKKTSSKKSRDTVPLIHFNLCSGILSKQFAAVQRSYLVNYRQRYELCVSPVTYIFYFLTVRSVTFALLIINNSYAVNLFIYREGQCTLIILHMSLIRPPTLVRLN